VAAAAAVVCRGAVSEVAWVVVLYCVWMRLCVGVDLLVGVGIEPSGGMRVQEDCGDIFTATGTVTLKRGGRHLLHREDVIHLIRQGRVAQVPTD
jgi:hypothetical protein